ncbi:dTMP kinase [Paenibacillus sp. UNCCL117]|uniref:dTMP kinase n=1 Tax=unclassified Paenibacillus TaxID=185978 RepID=UPI000889F7D7|nr:MULTISPECIES: dTMP kinase [unclassified Paenibacillus]SDE52918.1 dTMP kinase [Paenibacillus sp. cl123]SFW67927.1 dTMP kinase [Paenibacillus sp. UNCCL117]
MNRGIFISVEGGEGAGKTTAISSIITALAELGYEAVSTREPGGIAIAEQIRAIVLDNANTEMDSRTEALLYAAARRQHLSQKVIPLLESGRSVVCDRFIDSSLAYQGYARGLGIDEVFAINRFAIADWMPDLTLFLDVSPEVGLARIRSDDSRELNRLDLEKLQFHQMVREGYEEVIRRFPERVQRVNAEQTPEQVAAEIRRMMNQKLPKRI